MIWRNWNSPCQKQLRWQNVMEIHHKKSALGWGYTKLTSTTWLLSLNGQTHSHRANRGQKKKTLWLNLTRLNCKQPFKWSSFSWTSVQQTLSVHVCTLTHFPGNMICWIEENDFKTKMEQLPDWISSMDEGFIIISSICIWSIWQLPQITLRWIGFLCFPSLGSGQHEPLKDLKDSIVY